MSRVDAPDAAPEALPHFAWVEDTPALPAGAVGIAIRVSEIAAFSEPPRWPLHGSFRVPRRLAAGSPSTVLSRLVVTLTYGSTHDIQARPAFRDELLFDEDVEPSGEFLLAAFNVDLLCLFQFIARHDTYFISASIGDYVSDIIACNVEVPWLAGAHSPAPDPGEADEADDEDDAPWEEESEDGDTSWMIDDPLPM